MRPLVLVALATVYVVWSSTYLAVRIAVQTLPPLTMNGLRFTLAGSVLYVATRLAGTPAPSVRQCLASIPIGASYFLVGNGLAAVAGRHVPSGLVAVACAAMPLWAAVLGAALGQPSTRREWLGLGVGFAGVVMLGFGDLRFDAEVSWLLWIAPLGWATSAVLSSRLPVPRGPQAGALQMLAGGASLLVVGIFRGEALPDRVAATAWLAFAYLTSFGSILGFSAYVFLLQNTSRALATSHAYVNPLLAMVLGGTLGAERFAASTLIAALSIAIGVFVLLARGAENPRQRTSDRPAKLRSRLRERALDLRQKLGIVGLDGVREKASRAAVATDDVLAEIPRR